jgi:glycosyltransferase involved in cell wall biosynthesis
VRQAGRQVVYQPKSKIVHFEGVSHGTDTKSGIKAYQAENRKLFVKRWKSQLLRYHYPNGVHVPLARERGSGKTRVLVYDHYVPQPDRDAGSRTIFQLIQALLMHGVVVKFWPDNLHYDPRYTPTLERMGVEVIYGAEYRSGLEEWLSTHGRYIDAAFLSRPHISAPIVKTIRLHSKAKVLYYGHDLHFARLQSQMNISPSVGLEKEIRQIRRVEQWLWESVDTVYYPSAEEVAVVNSYLAGKGRRRSAKVLPPYAYSDFPSEVSRNLAERKSIVFVAGFAHPPNSSGAVWFARQVFPLIRKKLPTANLKLVGSSPTPEVLSLASETIQVTGFVSDEELSDIYRRARVAIAPMLFGAGVKGKVIESMRHGVPCVTTTVGAEGIAEATRCMFVADDAREFAAQVVRLFTDEVLWRTASATAQERCKSSYTFQGMWDAISGDLPEPKTSDYASIDLEFDEKLDH